MVEEKPKEKPVREAVVPAPPVEQALQAAKERKPPGPLARLFSALVHKASPEVEPLEEQARHLAREALHRPRTEEEAKERERRTEELRKLAEVEALKARLPVPEVEEKLLARPERMVELVVPLKPVAPPALPPALPRTEELLPARERYAPPARLPPTPEAARREEERLKEKAEETEAEIVLKEISRVAAEEAKAAEETGAPIHRRYLLRRAEEVKAGEGVRIRAPPEVAEKEEFAQLMQDVYTQLEASKREGVAEQLKVQEPPKPPAPAAAEGAAPPAEAKPLATMEELLGLRPAAKPAEAAPAPPAEAAPGAPLFAQLAEISGKPAQEKKPQVTMVQVEAKKGMGCPTCHSTNARVIFCPFCATGMCANCSPKITPKEDVIVYVCPHCGEEVTVKKKQA